MVMRQTYTIKESDGQWYWHVSTPGRPGDQSDSFPTRGAAEENVNREYPEAIPAELEDIYNKVPGRWRDDFMKAVESDAEPSDEFWQVGMANKSLRELFEKALRRDWLGNVLSNREIWEKTILGKTPAMVNLDSAFMGTAINKSELEKVARNICVMQNAQNPKSWMPFTAHEYKRFCNDNRAKDENGKPYGGEVGSAELGYLDVLAERGFLTCTQPKAANLRKYKSYEVNDKFVAMLVQAGYVS